MKPRNEVRPRPDSGKRGIQPAYPLGPTPPRPTPASAPTSADLVQELTRNAAAMGAARADRTISTTSYQEIADAARRTERALLARLAAYDALAAAARIEVARADRFGCRELRAALAELDGGATK